MVGGLQQIFLADVAGLAAGLQLRGQPRAVVIDHVHAETVRAALCNALPNAAHAQDAQGAAMDLGAGEHVVAPLGPKARAQEMLALGHAPRRGHQQGEAEVGGGLGQHVGRVGAQHTGGGHGVHVEVVVTHGHVGDDPEMRAGRQHLRVDALAAGGEGARLTLQALDQLGFGPDRVIGVGLDLEVLRQAFDGFTKNGARDQDGGTGRQHARMVYGPTRTRRGLR